MSCDLARIDAYLARELPPEASRAVASHLGTCLGCARELAALRAERALFARRASEVEVPAFEDVYLAARAHQPRRARRAPAWVAAAGIAASLLVFLGGSPAPVQPQGGACWLEPDAVASVDLVEVAEASEDARFEACLLASPAPHPRCF